MRGGGILDTFHSSLKASHISGYPELYPGDCVIGQNRLAIFGQTAENNQPLCIDDENISLIHNGNLYDFEKTFDEKHLPRKLQVDTELIYRLLQREHELAKESVVSSILERGIKTVENTVKGNYACLVIDVATDQKNAHLGIFVRDKPMWVCEDETGVYFFSTDRIGKKIFPESYAHRRAVTYEVYRDDSAYQNYSVFEDLSQRFGSFQYSFIIHIGFWAVAHNIL